METTSILSCFPIYPGQSILYGNCFHGNCNQNNPLFFFFPIEKQQENNLGKAEWVCSSNSATSSRVLRKRIQNLGLINAGEQFLGSSTRNVRMRMGSWVCPALGSILDFQGMEKQEWGGARAEQRNVTIRKSWNVLSWKGCTGIMGAAPGPAQTPQNPTLGLSCSSGSFGNVTIPWGSVQCHPLPKIQAKLGSSHSLDPVLVILNNSEPWTCLNKSKPNCI